MQVATCDTAAKIGIGALPAANDNLASITITAATGVITATGTTAAGGYTSILTPTAAGAFSQPKSRSWISEAVF